MYCNIIYSSNNNTMSLKESEGLPTSSRHYKAKGQPDLGRCYNKQYELYIYIYIHLFIYIYTYTHIYMHICITHMI